jgi:hypothetical protein
MLQILNVYFLEKRVIKKCFFQFCSNTLWAMNSIFSCDIAANCIIFNTVGFKKNGNCQKKFCQVLLNFYSLKRSFRIYVKKLHICVRNVSYANTNTTVKQTQIDINWQIKFPIHIKSNFISRFFWSQVYKGKYLVGVYYSISRQWRLLLVRLILCHERVA